MAGPDGTGSIGWRLACNSRRLGSIQGFLPTLDGMVKEGLATIEKATVIFYRAGGPPA